jgi:Sulfotransferase family
MYISVHVPKCAGTSFRHVLHGIYGAEIWYNYGQVFSREQARIDLIPAGVKLIHGHFLADSFDSILPERQLLTWVRHPVERLVSNYFHFLRAPDMRDDCCRALHEQKLSLREFADLDWMKNMATRYLANKPVSDFQFVGISEYFQESMRLFCRTYGFRTVMVLPRENINPDRKTEFYSLAPEDRAYILERNENDLVWYNEALKRLKEAGNSVSSKVA